MKKLLLVALLVATAFPAQAISRYNSQSMTCAEAQQRIVREKAVILRYRSPRGLPLYDRFVINDRMCAHGEFAKATYIPTSDMRDCFVLACESITYDGDNWDN